MIPWATQKRQVRIGLHLGLSLAGLLLLTVPFWVFPLDLAIQRAAWQGEAGWQLGEGFFWKFLYHYGTWPAVLVAAAALVALVLGAGGGRLAPWSKAAAYLVVCMAIGPGILVNLTLKDHWGRPRPGESREFGGAYPAETVWVADPASPGKSFPCGHCTMGFYFFAPALLLWRLGRRRQAAWVFGGAMTLGLLLGTARILQGGHFASDVLWGGGICWLVSVAAFYGMGLDESLRWQGSLPPWLKRGPVQMAGGGLGGLLLVAILVASPYEREDEYELVVASDSGLELSLILEGSRHRIRVNESSPVSGRITAAGRGHGLPGSGVKAVWKNRKEPSGQSYFQLKQRISGWFSELDHTNEVTVPNAGGDIRLLVRSGAAEVDLRGASVPQTWKLEVEPGARCRWEAGRQSGEVPQGQPVRLKLPFQPPPSQ